ncbi:DUF3895 domain-containing protein [Halalkalibacter okhensis]|uniref:Uncharacterized protein n=1 Tax=Halalkalibacter okhensis TaxID=333138 RepID=A0A0B0IF15_9BACI|nr:DUF3895 domain-containing protein [Halalkalibacter okhensis]KHF39457.1 hypothetical protein LQ50_15495 [Halalkalibacter okhensis]
MLSYKEKELIKDYVTRHEFFSLTELCDYLIENGSSSETYSTGKYKIYPQVALEIESYVKGSIIEMNLGENTVQYKRVGVISDNKEKELEQTKKETKEDPEPEMGQLSLF